MSKAGRTRRIIHFSTFIAAIIAGAFTVASVFAADPPQLPDFGAACTNGDTMSCSGPDSTCRIVCSSQSWQLCTLAKAGNTMVSDSFICQSSTFWKECDAGSAGNVVEGKTCAANKWSSQAVICDNDGVKDASEQCDFGAGKNDGLTNSSTQPLFTVFSTPAYGIQATAYTCDNNCQMSQVLVSGPNCGDSKTNGAEQCDSSLNCNNATCACDPGFNSQAEIDPIQLAIDPNRKICVPPPNLCGNNKQDGVEACDGGAHCTDLCTCENGFIPGFDPNSDPQAGDPVPCHLGAPVDLCGNGQRDAGEQCDKDGGQHCSNTCQCSAGYEVIPNNPNSISCQAVEEDAPVVEDPEVKSQCNDNKDNDNDGKKDYPADPGCSKKSDNSEVDPPKGAVKITDAEVFPVGFNPNMAKTEITYKLSGIGIVELTILDEAGVKLVTLINNEEIDGNSPYTISWDGTDKDEGGGKIVDPGKYFFKITVKESADAEVSDTKTGEINVIYATDIEAAVDKPQDKSVSALHNSPPKKTSGTGPETAIYLVFPLIGYFATKRSRH